MNYETAWEFFLYNYPFCECFEDLNNWFLLKNMPSCDFGSPPESCRCKDCRETLDYREELNRSTLERETREKIEAKYVADFVRLLKNKHLLNVELNKRNKIDSTIQMLLDEISAEKAKLLKMLE
tara:strand:+ start:284 stop:655 length:372 start_codon:yes stop_codon:yes gene_type:complete